MNIPQNFKLCAGLLRVSLFLPQVRAQEDVESWIAIVKSAVAEECSNAAVTFRIHDDWQKVVVGIVLCDGSREDVSGMLIQVLARFQSLTDVDVMDSFSDVVEF